MSIHHLLRSSLYLLVVSLFACAWCAQAAGAVNSVTAFRPVNPEELKMTSEPEAPGAPAVILYREVYRDDYGQPPHQDDYFRIKILTEEGRKYGDIEIPYDKDLENVTGIHARTIKPDGTIVDFDGDVITKSLIKAKGVKYLAKTFTLPAVQAGCVVEYFYTIKLSYALNSHWILSSGLFTKAAKFSLKPFTSNYWKYYLSCLNQNMAP